MTLAILLFSVNVIVTSVFIAGMIAAGIIRSPH